MATYSMSHTHHVQREWRPMVTSYTLPVVPITKNLLLAPPDAPTGVTCCMSTRYIRCAKPAWRRAAGMHLASCSIIYRLSGAVQLRPCTAAQHVHGMRSAGHLQCAATKFAFSATTCAPAPTQSALSILAWICCVGACRNIALVPLARSLGSGEGGFSLVAFLWPLVDVEGPASSVRSTSSTLRLRGIALEVLCKGRLG